MPAPAGIPWRIVLDESLPSVMRSIGLHVTGGQRDDTGRPWARMERPVLCTVVCRFDAPGQGRAAAGRFDVADLLRPLLGAGHATRPWGRRLDPLQGKTPAGAAETRASGARTPDRGGRSHDRVG